MKRVLSLFLSLIIACGVFSAGICAFAESSPHLLKEIQQGEAVCTSTSYFTKTEDLSLSETKDNGKKLRIGKGRRFKVLGKEKKGGSYAYIRVISNGEKYYGYIPKKNVSIDHSENYESKFTKKFNPYYNKNIKYEYYMHNGMPFYQFDQTHKSGWINGLRIGYSCGPHSLACALSALNGDVIFPETLMKKMSRSAPNSRGTGSWVSRVAQSTKSYVSERYHLNYEYKVISPYESSKYLKDGYMVILGVENRDSLNLFTNWSHYILLVDYDSFGNVMTANSNLKTELLEAFSYSRIRRNIRNQQFYYDNTLAIKYEYDDSYNEFEDEISSQVLKDTTISQHRNNMGKYFRTSAGKKIKLLGKRGSEYYVSYKYQGETKYGFIDSNCTDNTVIVKCDNSDLVYSGKEEFPKIKLTNVLNKKLSKDDYELIYPENSKEIGTYKVKIKYKNERLGKRSVEYRIIPKAPIISSIEAKKTIIKLNWDYKESLKKTKYLIEISETRDFKKVLKKEKVLSSEEKIKFEGLEKNKTYYIRAYAYTFRNGEKYSSQSTRVFAVKTQK